MNTFENRLPTGIIDVGGSQQTVDRVDVPALHGQEQGGEPVAAAHLLASALLQQVGGDLGAAHAGRLVQGRVAGEHDLVHRRPFLHQQADALDAAGLDG